MDTLSDRLMGLYGHTGTLFCGDINTNALIVGCNSIYCAALLCVFCSHLVHITSSVDGAYDFLNQ